MRSAYTTSTALAVCIVAKTRPDPCHHIHAIMRSSRIQELLAKAVGHSSLADAGQYTRPKSWGVYKVRPSKPSATKLYRIGNHPIRQHELHREFGGVSLVALFTSRALADELAGLYNAGPAE